MKYGIEVLGEQPGDGPAVERHESYRIRVTVDRGADVLVADRSIGAGQAEALKGEARRRVKTGAFFGHISYISVIARKPS